MLGQDDAVWEQSLRSNPYDLRTWCDYLKFKADEPMVKRCIIYERSLMHLSRSYKLWAAYLEERTLYLSIKSIADQRYATLIETYERSLTHMHKMPRIWINYCKLLIKLKKGTATRKVFDRALKALPVTQHDELWKLYVEWVMDFGVAETTKAVLKRYIMFEPGYRETFISYCLEQGDFSEAITVLKRCIDEENFQSSEGKTHVELHMQLCELLASHPNSAGGMDVEGFIRHAMEKKDCHDHIGKLWCQLANFYVRQGLFEKASSVFQEGVDSVVTVRDFSIIFDAMVKVEESTLLALMQGGVSHDSKEVEDRMNKIESLLQRRALLVNSVLLRQNPNNVQEWTKRVSMVLAEEDTEEDGTGAIEQIEKKKGKKTDVQVENMVGKQNKNNPNPAAAAAVLKTYGDALAAVNPTEATGRTSTLWVGLAQYLEKNGDVNKARETWKRAVNAPFKSSDELAIVVCGWAEMEMRLERYEEAREVVKKALELDKQQQQQQQQQRQQSKINKGAPADSGSSSSSSSVLQVRDSVKVWSLYLDLEEALGTLETCRAAYDQAMSRGSLNAQMCLNYAAYLEEANYFEDSFKVYERSVDLFTFPQAKLIWTTYLDAFIKRYNGGKVERWRDLFEQAVKDAPAEDVTELYLKYAQAEEKYGQPRRAMAVYDRATHVVPPHMRLEMYRLYVKKKAHFVDQASCRSVYERAIKELKDEDACAICVDFAAMEKKLGELERARALYVHGSQFANPSRNPNFWASWRDFEESHGNEDTFRDMLRTQRTVEASFSHVNYAAIDMVAASSQRSQNNQNQNQNQNHHSSAEDGMYMEAGENGSGRGKGKFVSSAVENAEDNVNGDTDEAAALAATKRSRREDEDEDEKEGGLGFVEKSVPKSVFGGFVNEN